MRVLVEDSWQDGFHDYWRFPTEYRIAALAWANIERLADLYFVRSPSVRMVLNYVREVGPVDVLRKIRSRRQERARNEKYVSCGIGIVLEGPNRPDGGIDPGTPVGFVAPLHPACAERICLPPELLVELPIGERKGTSLPSGPSIPTEIHVPADGFPAEILYLPLPPSPLNGVGKLRGWSPYSGVSLDEPGDREAVEKLLSHVLRADWRPARHLDVSEDLKIEERHDASAENSDDRPSAVLFGYGNYAKTTILPNLNKEIRIQRIHEIDPVQIQKHAHRVSWDTSAYPRSDAPFDVCVVAGYHSLHAPIAVRALDRGASLILEKPIAVDHDQLGELVTAMERSSGQVFVAFQRRYSPFNRVAREDLRVEPPDPISYHCIVYEVPLPELHWYRWPSSGSRIISNGCHWIDHFLFLNGYPQVRNLDLFRAGRGTLNCALELENQAVFSMTLTAEGSDRLGVQDHVQLRANGVTVRIDNNSRYMAESSRRVIRKRSVRRGASYREMYRSIGRSIRAGMPGDSVMSVQRSGETVLQLEALLDGRS